MSEFTSGPWAVSKQKARRVTASGVVICNAVLRNQGGPKHKAFLKDEHEAEANANLIAAAPDMYAALVALRPHIFIPAGDTAFAEAMEAARDAIFKAEGRS